MKYHPTAATAADLQAEISARRVRLAELRAQRPFRHVATAANVISIAAARRNHNPLLQIGGAL